MGTRHKGVSRRRATLIAILSFAVGIVGATTSTAAGGFLQDLATDQRRAAEVDAFGSASCPDEWRPSRPDAENLDILVRASPEDCWTSSVAVGESKTVDVVVRYSNYTKDTIKDVSLHGWIPDGVTLVASSTYLSNTTNPKGYLVANDSILVDGVNIGDYDPRGVAYVKYTIQVTEDYAPVNCGPNMFSAAIRQSYPSGTVWSTAGVITKREC
ncbi:hypothetical protein SAMN06295974_3767 [Plantibacter flavus]|uniref:DUF11 domain-containing protein n=1 Tax=Plantibacter flavus TaxID=150123 RepID=A0A3N2BLE4_9MICO|nr:hypothetical protein [Plantibacter flavus]ROR76085.1 hypothetical protein EDD42_4038 [Plantibacter flavus]SMG48774.1 hypothetical protein SAMN06295974_3767 [Plantibacter flavus]